MPPGDVLTLVGRGGHLASIETFLTRSAEFPVALCLFGAPGVGRTALLDAAAHSAAERGAVVLRAAGVRSESEVPLATLHLLLSPLREYFADLSTEHDRTLSAALGFEGASSPEAASLATAATALLRRRAPDSPVLLTVDDWQWVDPESIAVLTRVGYPLLFAMRGESPVQVGTAELLEVLPLEETDAYLMVTDRFPVIPKWVARRLLVDAQGNPLALLEIARSLSEDQRSGRKPLPSPLAPTGRLHAYYTNCVRRLPPQTRRLLLLAALDDDGGEGSPVDGWVAAEQARLGSYDPDRGRWVFGHPAVRSAVVRSSTGRERAAVHAELARDATGRPDVRARHLAHATIGPDEAVAELLQGAAHRALSAGDAIGAVTALLRAAELSVDGPPRSRRLAEAAYIGANVAGDLRTMPTLLIAARKADPDGTGSLPIAVAAAHLLLNGDGHIDTAHRLLSATVNAAFPRAAADPLLIEALYQLADVCFYGAREDLWAALEAALTRLGSGTPALLHIYVQVLHNPASLTASDRMRLQTALQGLDEEHDPTTICRIGRVAAILNLAARSRSALARVIDDGRAGGAVGSAINAMMVVGLDDLYAGRSDAADAVSAEALQLCDTHGYGLMAWPLRLIRMIVAARRGQEDRVREPAAQVAAWAVPRGARKVAATCSWAQATLAVGRGDFEEAYHHCVAVATPGLLPPDTTVAAGVSLELIEAALRTGRRDEAIAHARAVAASGLTRVSPAFGITVLAAAALVADDDQALALFSQALAVPGALGLGWDHARVQLFYGERLRRVRAIAEARRHLGAASAAFERMGAAPWVARANRELEATAVTRTWDRESGDKLLTPQETQVAALAAAGLNNKQIGERLLVSHRTVSAHLSRVYGKLGVSSRVALAAVFGSDADAGGES